MPTLPSILLVDDNYTNNFLNTRLLLHLDPTVRVRTALNGQEALDVLRTHCQPPMPRCPALIFLDLNMPIMDGFEFLEAYQQFSYNHQQRPTIVVLTTSASPRDLTRLQALPGIGLLAKPLTKEKVAQVLADYFPLNSVAGSL